MPNHSKLHEKISNIIKSIDFSDLKNVSTFMIMNKAIDSIVDNDDKSIYLGLSRIATDMITIDQPDYQYMAARFIISYLKQKNYGDDYPDFDSFLKFIIDYNNKGLYTDKLLKWSIEEIKEIYDHVDHDLDKKISMAGMSQYYSKYLLQDRTTGEVLETPNMRLIIISLALNAPRENDNRSRETLVEDTISLYQTMSGQSITLSSPPTSTLGKSGTNQSSACVLIDAEDSMEGLSAACSTILKYIPRKAGIGLNLGRIRAINSKINNGKVVHTGVTSFTRLMESAVESCSRGGMRGGSGTVFFPVWHKEITRIVNFKNPMLEEDLRVENLDYAIQYNKYILNRIANNEDIYLFSPHVMDGELYESFFSDQDRFKELYERAIVEVDDQDKDVISAVKLATSIASQGLKVNRIYSFFTDNTNNQSPYIKELAPIYMSNLCVEITQPTIPLNNERDRDLVTNESSDGLVALCTLGAINVGVLPENLYELYITNRAELVKVLEEILFPVCDTLVRTLNRILDIQEYPIPESKEHTELYRPLGIGISNLAYLIAKSGYAYGSEESYKIADIVMESIQYFCLYSSMRLSQENNSCIKGISHSRYIQGESPLDWYNKNTDEITSFDPIHDWEALSSHIKVTGLINATLTAIMPTESSSQKINAISSFLPMRNYVTVKKSPTSYHSQVVPTIENMEMYNSSWDFEDNSKIIKMAAVLQRWTDQAISTDRFYTFSSENEKGISMNNYLNEIYMAHHYGLKTLYYVNVRDSSTEKFEDVNKDEECEVCVV